MRERKKAWIFLVFFFVLSWIVLPMEFVDAKEIGTETRSAGAAKEKQTTYVVLYAVDSSYDQLVIPEDYKQQYQIHLPNSGNVSYRVVEGDSATVSKDGCIKPAGTVYYWNGNIGTTVSTGAEGETSTIEYTYDRRTVIEATVNKDVYRFVVVVKDYATIYADQIMDAYLSSHITDSMTNMEKLQAIAEFPCQYDYSAEHSGVIGMVIYGGGDCWASTDAIECLCEKAGLDARSRDARSDPGAGNGHMNAVVKIDGELYIVEAGYDEEAPRHYNIREEEEYDYELNSDQMTITLTNYNGLDRDVIIPQYYGGYPVTVLGDEVFAGREEMKTVVIPDSVKVIGERAFYDTCLQSVKIPEGIEEIGREAFYFFTDYDGPFGSYGAGTALEMFELPASIKILGMDLSESIVMYHGSEEQWKNIIFTDTYREPEAGKLFFSSKGLEASEDKVELQYGDAREISIYTIGGNINIMAADPDIVRVSFENKEQEYEYYRDGSGNHIVSTITTLKVNALRNGSTVLTVSNGSESISIPVNVLLPDSPKTPRILSLHAEESKSITVKWESKSISSTGYQIQYSTVKTFKKNTVTKTVKNASSDRLDIKKLKPGKNYYVRIRAYKTVNGKNYYSAWSKARSVTTKK